MTGSDLARMFEFSYAATKRNLDGVSNEESLQAPGPEGNCINWVLGHIVVHRGIILSILGSNPPLADDRIAVYGRGSNPLHHDHPTSVEKALDLATLRGYLDDSQQQLIPALAVMTDETLALPVPPPFNKSPLTGSIGDALARLIYHEGYHNGQIGLLRRLVGKERAIR